MTRTATELPKKAQHMAVRSIVFFSVCLLSIAGSVGAQEEQLLAVYIDGVEDELLENILSYLQIVQAARPISDESIADWLREKVKQVTNNREAGAQYRLPVSETRVRWLHGKAKEDIRRALQPFGYHQPTIDDRLQRSEQGWEARYQITLGDPGRIAKVDIQILGEGGQDSEVQKLLADFPLTRGAVLYQPVYEEWKKKLRRIATDRGYFDGSFETKRIQIDLQSNSAAVIVRFDTGKRYRFGEIKFPDIVLAPELLQRYLQIQPGDAFDASKLLKLQSDLINSDYFSRVEVEAPENQAADLRIPVHVNLEMRNARQLLFGLGFATDTGVRGRTGLQYRWLNPRGHRWRTELRVSEIKQGIATAYEIPGASPSTDLYSLNARLTREDSETKDTDTIVITGSWRKKLGLWERFLGLNYGLERFREDQRQTSVLLVPEVSFVRLAVDDPLSATRGSRLELKLLSAFEPLLSDVSFLQPRVNGKLVWSFGQRHRLIGRADMGNTTVSDFSQLPSNLRFYAGGDKSVRGYDLNKISPVNEDGDEVGGKHLVVGSLEYEYRFLERWGAAVFVDSGDAFNDNLDLKTGVGVGLRWFSPVGPVRVDVARGLRRTPGDDIRLHLTIGPEF